MSKNQKILIIILAVLVVAVILYLVWKNRNKLDSKAPRISHNASFRPITAHVVTNIHPITNPVNPKPHQVNSIHLNPVKPIHPVNPKPIHPPKPQPVHPVRPIHPRPKPRPQRVRFVPIFYTLYYPLNYNVIYPVDYTAVNPEFTYDYTIADSEALWENYVTDTRAYIQAALRASTDLPAVTDSLLANYPKFGQFYNSTEINNLMKNHLLIALDITNSILQNGKLDPVLINKWQDNIKQLAITFAGITRVSESDALNLLKEHLNLTAQQFLAEYKCVKGDTLACQTSEDMFTQIKANAKTIADSFTQ